MKKTLAVSLLLLFAVAAVALGHAGETHNYMGTVTAVHGDGSFVLKKTDGSEMNVGVTKSTVYLRADNKSATAGELKPGSRVVAKIGTDGKTALRVTMAAQK